jgi:integrase
MGTVTALRPAEDPTLGDAIEAYLASYAGLSVKSRAQYAATLNRLADRFGSGTPVADVDAGELSEWVKLTWGARKPATWNRATVVLRSAWSWWVSQRMTPVDAAGQLPKHSVPPDRSRALSRAQVEQLLESRDAGLRERVLWRLLYESAARAAEVLALDVQDLDLVNRRAKVIRKGGATDVITWQTGTARLLPRLLKRRKTGPVFVTERKSKLELSPLDTADGYARLSYRQAAQLFTDATSGMHDGPFTLHYLRHSALTHAAEEGANTSTLMAYSGHTSVRSLVRYARVSPEALARWQAERDPVRRR